MKNDLEADSGKIQPWHNAYYARLTPSRLLVGLLSIALLLFSLIGAIAVDTSTHATAARATLATNSVSKHTVIPTDTSTPTITPSPSPTSSATPSPTSTSTPTSTPTTTATPTPTSTSLPSPTSTSIPSPTPTKIAFTPPPTSVASPTPYLSPTRSSPTAVASAMPGATSTIPAIATQSSGQGQTPTTSSTSNTIQSASPNQQNADFPFIALAIGVPGTTAAIAVFFIGWWLLRKRLLPVKKVKLPPSGANPWSRVRTSNTLWNMHSNGSTQPASSNNQLYNGPAPWGQHSVTPVGIPFNRNIAPPINNVAPTPNGFGQTSMQYDFAPSSQLSFSSFNQMHNASAIPAPSKPEVNGLQATDNNTNNGDETDVDAYKQWLHNNRTGAPDLNNPYLHELIKQYSDKSRAARQQKPSNTSNEQASQTPNDDTWLR
jgi:hypothetical protein